MNLSVTKTDLLNPVGYRGRREKTLTLQGEFSLPEDAAPRKKVKLIFPNKLLS